MNFGQLGHEAVEKASRPSKATTHHCSGTEPKGPSCRSFSRHATSSNPYCTQTDHQPCSKSGVVVARKILAGFHPRVSPSWLKSINICNTSTLVHIY